MTSNPKRYDVERNLYHSFKQNKVSSLQRVPQTTPSRQNESHLVTELKELTYTYIFNAISSQDFTIFLARMPRTSISRGWIAK